MPLLPGLSAGGWGEGSSGWHDEVRAHSTAATVLPLVKLQGYRKESQGNLSWALLGSALPKHSTVGGSIRSQL